MKTIFLNLLLCLTFLLMNIGNASSQQNHEYVDLGLPSGTLWATCNVGTNNEWENGNHYSWGETSTKRTYKSNCKYYIRKGLFIYLKKYCNDDGEGYKGYSDNYTILEKADDAAYVNWGSNWCMPTLTQYEELCSNCYWVWTDTIDNQGHKYIGYMVYKALNTEDKGVKIYVGKTADAAYTENVDHIFFPAAGLDFESSEVGYSGFYWSSSLDIDNPKCAKVLFIDSGYMSGSAYTTSSGRSHGHSVRPVRSKK